MADASFEPGPQYPASNRGGMMRPGRTVVKAIAVGLFLSLLVACAYARLYGVTTWDGNCPENTTVLSWADIGRSWYDEVTDRAAHGTAAFRKGGTRIDGRITNSIFADEAIVTWGRDHHHIDKARAALVFLHGVNWGGAWRGAMRMGERGAGDCSASQKEMIIGNSNLDFLHLSSCSSLDVDQWPHWWESFQGLHQVNGFNGCMWPGSETVDLYRSFASDSFSYPIAQAWIDNMYCLLPSRDAIDVQCPVSYTVGTSMCDAWLRLSTESYSNTLADPKGPTWWAALYVEGCKGSCG